MMDAVTEWSNRTRAEKACAALVKHGFDAVYVPGVAEAADLVMSFVKPGMSVGFGGSMTVRALGIREKVDTVGARALDHNTPGLDPKDRLEIQRAQLTCDVFVSGSNAVTLKGEIFNIDANGNRVAALTFGPRKTVVVVGANKIVENETEAVARMKARAAPMNNRRLARDNPCVAAGRCVDCENPTRICRVYQVLRRKPLMSDFTVIIVGDDLGY